MLADRTTSLFRQSTVRNLRLSSDLEPLSELGNMWLMNLHS